MGESSSSTYGLPKPQSAKVERAWKKKNGRRRKKKNGKLRQTLSHKNPHKNPIVQDGTERLGVKRMR